LVNTEATSRDGRRFATDHAVEVRGEMAGYSETSQAKKLGINPGCSVGLEHAPPGWSLIDAPDDVSYVVAPKPADVLICFCTAAAQLSTRLLGRDVANRPMKATTGR
jgi:hypothetical protein